MKTTNLQAPWRVIVSQYSNQKPSAWEITTRYGGVIAETNNLTNDTIPRLIAAAPDLLSALRFLLADYVAIEGETLTGSSVPADMARAAISKAEGVA
jgi:hypothetical protein